ncbi:MAG: hypothetical protein FWD46_00260 [Cystobacterineae bacterium]|nr:hypothetical protein [Cystobacterineae bacterium]
MRAFVLSLFLLLASSAQAQPEERPRLNNFSYSENARAETSRSGISKYKESLEKLSEPVPLTAISLGIAVLLFTLPFAVHYFGDMSREMRSAQTTNTPPKTLRQAEERAKRHLPPGKK